MATISAIILTIITALIYSSYEAKDKCIRTIKKNYNIEKNAVITDSTWMRISGSDGMVGVVFSSPLSEDQIFVCKFTDKKTDSKNTIIFTHKEYSLDKLRSTTDSASNPFNFRFN